jgi:L-fuconolactonase
MNKLSRRTFLGSAAAVGAAAIATAQAAPIPIIDCHIHLFDQNRPQGAPYSGGRGNTEPALPPRYRRLATPLGIAGAIEIEASPWVEDNRWVLEVEERDPAMVGSIGNLQPDKPEFKEYLARYHKNKLFLGIRYGNNWGYGLAGQVSNPAFIEGLKLMQQADLALDTANPRPDLLEAVLTVTDKVPGLRIVIDHLPSMFVRTGANGGAAVEGTLRELAKRTQVYVKLSEVLRLVDGTAATDPAIFDIFGENHVIFGSGWPNQFAAENLPAIVKIVQDYFGTKSRAAAEKFFWRNSVAAYKWLKRDPSQPQP